MFYTYIHFRKDNNQPFYIGKGKGNRCFTKKNRNNHWNNIAKKHGFHVEICSKWDNEKDAFEHEKFLINCFKSMNIQLVNMTDGGEGSCGWIPSKEWRAKKSESQKKNFVNPMFNNESKLKSINSRKGRKLTNSHKKSIGISLLGNKSRTGQKNSEQSNIARAEKLKGNKHSLGVKQTPEANLKRSIALKAFWALKKSSSKESYDSH